MHFDKLYYNYLKEKEKYFTFNDNIIIFLKVTGMVQCLLSGQKAEGWLNSTIVFFIIVTSDRDGHQKLPDASSFIVPHFEV